MLPDVLAVDDDGRVDEREQDPHQEFRIVCAIASPGRVATDGLGERAAYATVHRPHARRHTIGVAP